MGTHVEERLGIVTVDTVRTIEEGLFEGTWCIGRIFERMTINYPCEGKGIRLFEFALRLI